MESPEEPPSTGQPGPEQARPRDGSPDPAELTVVASAPVPGGSHVLMTSGRPGDESLHQFFFDDTGMRPLDGLAEKFGAALAQGRTLGAGTLLGTVLTGLSCRAGIETADHIEMSLVDEDGTERYRFSSYRRVWPTNASDLEMLSNLIGPHAPELVGRIEVEVHGRHYILGTCRRTPSGPTVHDLTAARIAAQYFSHEDSVEVGQTIRYVHDALLLAFPHRWVPAELIGRHLEERLDGFLPRIPGLAAHAPWIRESYRSLTGEMLVQRIHGNLTATCIWHQKNRCIVGGWQGDVRLRHREHTSMRSPLHDLATLQSSIFSACNYELSWFTKTMSSFFEGYGEPTPTHAICLFILDTACQETLDLPGAPDHGGRNLGDFLTWFRETFVPHFAEMPLSTFHRRA